MPRGTAVSTQLTMRKQLPAIFSILDTSAMGGAETYLLSNLEYLAGRGHPVYLATNCQAVRDFLQTSTQVRSQLTLIDMPFRLDAIGNWKGLVKFFLFSPVAASWLFSVKRTYLRKHQQVTGLLPGFSDRLFFSPWLKAWGYRLLWLEYGPLEPTFARNFGFPKLLYRATQDLPDTIITISQATFHSLLTTGQLPSQQVEIVYPGTAIPEASEIKSLRQQADVWRKKHGITSSPIILAIGRLATEKEFDVLIKAFQLVGQQLRTPQLAQLVIMGDGPEREKLETLVADLKLTRQVTFTGFVAETEKKLLLATASVFVFPSAWPLEGFGMTTIEAMSFGVPVITTGAGPQAEIVTDQVESLYFEAGNINALASQINRVLTTPQLAQKISRAGKTRAAKVFSEEQMHQAIARII